MITGRCAYNQAHEYNERNLVVIRILFTFNFVLYYVAQIIMWAYIVHRNQKVKLKSLFSSCIF